MNILRDVAGGLLKMFIGDAWVTGAILIVVALAGLLVNAGVGPLVRGAILFFGSIAVLVTNVILSVRRYRDG